MCDRDTEDKGSRDATIPRLFHKNIGANERNRCKNSLVSFSSFLMLKLSCFYIFSFKINYTDDDNSPSNTMYYEEQTPAEKATERVATLIGDNFQCTDLFCQMDVLRGFKDDYVWQEMARLANALFYLTLRRQRFRVIPFNLIADKFTLCQKIPYFKDREENVKNKKNT